MLDMELLELNTPPCNFCQVKSLITTVQSFAKKTWMQFWFHQQLKTIDKRLLVLEEDKSKYQIKLKTDEGNKELLANGSGFVEGLEAVGIDEEVEDIAKLIEKRSDLMMVITVWGPGGSGKTTLAKQVYKRVRNDRNHSSNIEFVVWVDVNHSSNIEFVLRTIINALCRSVGTEPPQKLEEAERHVLEQRILAYLEGKRYVLFFDDVWDRNLLTQIKIPGHRTSSIIITSRDKTIADGSFIGAAPHHVEVKPLEFDLACSLFCKLAFWRNPSASAGGGTHAWPNDTIKKHGEALVKRCDCLPVAILALAQLMSTKGDDPREWKETLESLDSQFEGNLASVNRALLLSYNELPTHLKYCFLYCAMFPKTHNISAKNLVRLCVAEGFVNREDIARNYFLQLKNRSLLQIVPKDIGEEFGRIQMHDLFRELACLVSKREIFAEMLDQNSELELKQRRLIIQDVEPKVKLDNCKNMKLRTLLISEVTDFNPFPQMLQNMKLLRVLVLESMDIENLPDEVGDLIHLRYMSLRDTRILHIPDSLGRLHNLQTLDVRSNILMSLPKCVSELKQLRHLFGTLLEMPDIDFTLFSQLQTLSGVRINTIQARGLENITQLTKLKIYFRGEKCWREICSSVKEMTNLRSLHLRTKKDDEAREFGNFSPPLSLEKLTLIGCGKLAKFTTTLDDLRVIRLASCVVDEDFLICLEKLPSLVSLDLQLDVEKLSCSAGSFPKLKLLRIESDTLTKWEIGKGAMNCLQSLDLINCEHLETLPEGLKELEYLKELHIRSPSTELRQSVRVGGPDRWKVVLIPNATTFD